MFYRKIIRCSSSAYNDLFLLFLIEGKSCIKHACDNFGTLITYYVEPRKNTKSIV
jgi:hypothetical protein